MPGNKQRLGYADFDLVKDIDAYPVNGSMVIAFRGVQVAYLDGWTQQQANQLVDVVTKICGSLEEAYTELLDNYDQEQEDHKAAVESHNYLKEELTTRLSSFDDKVKVAVQVFQTNLNEAVKALGKEV